MGESVFRPAWHPKPRRVTPPSAAGVPGAAPSALASYRIPVWFFEEPGFLPYQRPLIRFRRGETPAPCLVRRVMIDLDMDGNNMLQPDASGGRVVVGFDQQDGSQPFIEYSGQSASDGTKSASSNTGELGAVGVKISFTFNGVTYWMRGYVDHT